MEILKGKVQDPGFPDTEITYLKADDGKTYFFVENGTLKNGNYIATPILKEGIGHAPYTSLGLLSKNGDVLIPFENKNIQVLSNNLLLVERNKPATESVVAAISKQSDPLSASELVESANTIKEQIKSVMGSNGNFVFDNQFSEAALYTTDGVNLANNYFSFIGGKDGAYFMSTNVVGSPISKYDPYAFAMENENSNQPQQEDVEENNNQQVNEEQQDNEIQEQQADNEIQNTETEIQSEEQSEVQDETQAAETSTETLPGLDIPNIDNQVEDTNSVQNQEQDTSGEIQIPQVPSNDAIQTENVQLPQEQQDGTINDVPDLQGSIDIPLFGDGVPLPQESDSAMGNNLGEIQQESSEILNNLAETQQDGGQQAIDVPADTSTEIPADVNETSNESQSIDSSDVSENTDSLPGLNISLEDENIVPDQQEQEDDSEQETETDEDSDESDEDTDENDDSSDEEEDYEETEEVEDSSEEESEDDDSEEDTDEYEEEITDDVGGETESQEQDEEDDYEESDDEVFEEDLGNPIIANATNTIKKLLDENRNQRQQLDQQENELYTLKSSNELLQEDNASKTKEIISLRNALGKARRDNTDLLRENNQMKSTTSRQEEIIDNLKSQNSALKEQVAGISALNSAVAEANTLFGADASSEYGYLDDGDGYQYTKTAA